ncbi:hypothetical protein PROFUN_13996 [Planoprotostelium fungivorum]|uniref:Uncharacterized protein n=1 Tax=Planoprotostelium fungivorum TaxID=1890364 RepID=A0A2P6N2L6_9EUKA|nr:hypothetical protein PROFUN_13990 [Planoprotostelium fungivorum]PRP78205.1 hypothetical protein PROFUN_13996 [Planoprotostelium fungivorum]
MVKPTELDAFFQHLDTVDQLNGATAYHEPISKKPTSDVAFDLLQVGTQGEFDLIPRSIPFKSTTPFALTTSNYPLPKGRSDEESLLKEIEEEYMDPRRLIHGSEGLPRKQKWWPRQIFPNRRPGVDLCVQNELYQIETSSARTTLEVVMNESTGEANDFREVSLTGMSSTPFNSMSLDRPLGNREDFHRGSTENQPFMPGGVDVPSMKIAEEIKKAPNEPFSTIMEDKLSLQPPGFQEPVYFDEKRVDVDTIQQEIERLKDRSNQIVSNPADMIAPYIDSEPQDEMQMFRKKEEFMNNMENKKKEILSFNTLYADDDDEHLDASLDHYVEELDNSIPHETAADLTEESAAAPSMSADDQSLEELLSIEESFNNYLSSAKKRNTSDGREEWAIMEPIDVSDFQELVPEMAIDYPFDLDGFQKEAVIHLERGESVFIGAHTSAGKTVVAEYAIALAAKHMTRAIYTSPIKALSNQKFRDFKSTFGDVGLITGDVQIKPEASCLILTTEILRSMLYRGADIIRDVEWVIFDEVHYVNDMDRGVVWEEVIIMLPAHVNIILLSATVPNTYEFADWVGRTKKKKIWVISTMKRPVPLEHYLYTSGEVYKIVDNKLNFLSGGYRAITTALKDKGKNKMLPAAAKSKAQQNEWSKLVNHLKNKGLLPVVVFAFSKKKCEECAYGLTGVDLTTGAEKAQIHHFIEDSVSRLKGSDKRLPQVMRIKEILKRGVGVHHGGLLPIIKEVVEILFSRGLVKVLFATETFAMGVNMPTRTVVFNSIRKHDGRGFRELLSGEYIQMSGRAGRRGLDTVGTVIIACWDEAPDAPTLSSMILGKATRLESQFRLTYNMILNLLRVEGFKVEDMIKRSFSEFSSQKLLPEQKSMLSRAENVLKTLAPIDCIFGEPDIENYHALHSEKKRIEEDMQVTILSSKSAAQSLVPGRLVVVNTKEYPQALATVLKLAPDTLRPTDVRKAKLLVLVDRTEKNSKGPITINPGINMGNEGVIADLPLNAISRITKEKLKTDVSKITGTSTDTVMKTVTQQMMRYIEEDPFGPQEVDPIKELKINDLSFGEKNMRKNNLAKKMVASKCHQCPKLSEQYSLMSRYAKIKSKVNILRFALSDENLQLMPEFQTRLGVLERLRYIDSDKTVLMKGRVAREINTVTDELIATELIFENVLTPLTPAEIVSLLSCLIFEEKTEAEPMLTPTLEGARSQLIAIATGLANIQIEGGLLITVSEYVKNIKFGMMEVVYEWARQMPFSDIAQLTEVQEGSIVRCIVRLDETCKEVRNAARIIGDTALYTKMEQASQMIKRDIVFASSLYVS